MKATIRIGLTGRQASSCNAAMITHIRDPIPMDVVVGGVKYDLADLIQRQLGVDSVEVALVNTSVVEARREDRDP